LINDENIIFSDNYLSVSCETFLHIQSKRVIVGREGKTDLGSLAEVT